MTKKKEVVTQKEEALYIIFDHCAGLDRYVECRGKEDLVKELQDQFVVEYDGNFEEFINWLDYKTDILKIESGQVSNVRDDVAASIRIETKIKINY